MKPEEHNEQMEEVGQTADDSQDSDTYAAQEAAEDAGRENDPASGGNAADDAGRLLEEARRQAEENYNRFLRVQADYDNFRRRTRQEKEDLIKYSSMKVVEQLLPVFDNFERALLSAKETKEPDALAKGVEMIVGQFRQVLEQEGVKPMDAVGQPFNPQYHQAIMQVESEEYEEGIVVEEVQKGYMMKEKVLRPAMVKVSS